MIDRKKLLTDLKRLLREMEADLRARCDEVAEINRGLTEEYNQARAANRVGTAFEEWRADLITQVAAAWVLSCVFVRFLEDNSLISPPWISGPLHAAGDGQGLMRARDERDLFFRSHPKLTDRDYLLAVFDDLSKLPGTKEVFGSHNLVHAYRDWLSGDAAQRLIEFFQKIDADGTGEIIHNFKDERWDTRFLGDLYQDLSEAARKKYALLQTPEFVEEFILERTLELAIKEFGLRPPRPEGEGGGEGIFKMIDPACGSGHFVLGSFARILDHWRKAEPGTSVRELVNRALASVHGVDINPYAVAIARFRLLLMAMRECQITRLKDAPNFQFNFACGDSLLHGSLSGEQQVLGFHELSHHYQSEDIDELLRILAPSQYHTVVANPPYITVKDKILNQAYRERYPEVCYRQYSLVVPFMQRLFTLACEKGFTGQITANSFMKREFGKRLVEDYLPRIDLTHVIDTSGGYIPGHGTPTVILFTRNRGPVGLTVRTVMGIKGEPSTPSDPAQGQVWTAILQQIDLPGSESAFISVNDMPREQFRKHPWSIGGGGAAELKETLDETAVGSLGSLGAEIGIASWAGIDDVCVMDPSTPQRLGWEPSVVKSFVTGDFVRDWTMIPREVAATPYDPHGNLVALKHIPHCASLWWLFRSHLRSRVLIGGKTFAESGKTYHAWVRWIQERYVLSCKLAFAFIATHNHFVLDRGGKVFNRSVPVITLPPDATENDYLGILGLLNSSTACFWMKQVFHNKGSTVDQHGARQRTMPFEDFWEHDGTKLKQFPLPVDRPQSMAKKLDTLAQQLTEFCAYAVVREAVPTADLLEERRGQFLAKLAAMVALQEELDWACYALYGFLDLVPSCLNPPSIQLGQRAFEIVLARKMARGEEATTYFARHGSIPNVEIPVEWPEEYRKIVEERIVIIESERDIGLIERPEYKRRWNVEPWEQQIDKALRKWLLNRLESYFDIDGRMNDQKTVTAKGELQQPRLSSLAKIADVTRHDKEFMQVAELYAGRMDFDVSSLVADLITTESVPCLPVLRYKPSGLDKRAVWERTWELQRLEDAVDALFDVERLKEIEPGKAEATLRPQVSTLPFDESAKGEIIKEVLFAAALVAKASRQGLLTKGEEIFKQVTDAAKRAKHAAVGDIPVPPKYTSADFLSSDFWRLRGKLDVPKERWVSFPHCEGEDGTLVIAWAGYDHLQLARAIAERYEQAKEYEGRKLVPLLACIGQLIPWLKQWHNDLDPTFGTRMGDYFEGYLFEEAKALGMTVAEVMAWTPPAKANGRRRRRVRS